MKWSAKTVATQPTSVLPATIEKRAVVWRWKGTRADIVRIAEAVQQAVGGAPLEIEVVDAMGKSTVKDLAMLEEGLAKRESFKTLAFVSASLQRVCESTVVFDAKGVHTKAAVTVITSGDNAAAVENAHATALRMVLAGAREPKDVPTAELEKWGAIGCLAGGPGAFFAWLGTESGDAGLIALAFVLCVVGVLSAIVWLGYEALVPQVELLRSGQKTRLFEAAKWVGLTVGGFILTALAAAAFS